MAAANRSVQYRRIKNAESILANAQTQNALELRRTGLEILEEMVSQLQPQVLLKQRLRRAITELFIGRSILYLENFDDFLVIGGGKAVLGMVEFLETLLPDKDLRGVLSVPEGFASQAERTSEVQLREASHPIPDVRGLKATEEMAALLKDATERTLVFFLISGGGSALMPLPAKGISLEAKLEVNRLLLESGASISEFNTVRKHISAWKGGQAAKLAYPATTISLVLSDVLGDPLDIIASGPTAPDPSTFLDAHQILRKYALWERVDETISSFIGKGMRNEISETPKEGEPAFQKVITEIIGNNRAATNIIAKAGQKRGYKVFVLTNFMQGEAREIGRFVGAIGIQMKHSSEPIASPGIVVLGGETTVTVTGKGEGGRNQELALACSSVISGLKHVAVFSFGTDGIDGTSNAAGAVVDGLTAEKIRTLGLDIEKILHNNDSGSAFKITGDHILTGYTGTNVADIVLIISLGVS
ncbi:MAG: glycerate kinase [Candidatus Thorarchaeota archaeon]